MTEARAEEMLALLRRLVATTALSEARLAHIEAHLMQARLRSGSPFRMPAPPDPRSGNVVVIPITGKVLGDRVVECPPVGVDLPSA
jgi:hypothetical protein